jgi:hypothetical protein
MTSTQSYTLLFSFFCICRENDPVALKLLSKVGASVFKKIKKSIKLRKLEKN